MNQLKHRFLFGARLLSLVVLLIHGLSAYAAPSKATDASASARSNQNHYAIKPGQSLQDVVAELAEAGVVRTPKERAQLTSALLQANPRAFIAGDPNRLRKDAVLILPPGFERPQAALPTAPAEKPSLPSSEALAETDTQTQSEEQAVASPVSSASSVSTPPPAEQQTSSAAPVSATVAAAPPAISASSTSAKVLAMLSSWHPQFTSIPKALMFVMAALVSVLLVLILSLFGHRRIQRRMNEQRTPSIVPISTSESELTQEPSEVDQMMAQVASWAQQHPPALLPPAPSSPVEQVSAEVPHSPTTHLTEEAQPDLDDVQQPLTGATPSTERQGGANLSEPTSPAVPPAVETLASPSILREVNEAELNKLEKVNEAINLGDMESARALISEVTELVQARLVAEQTKQAPIDSAADEIEEISTIQKEEQQQTVSSAPDAEPLHTIDLPSETTESPPDTYAEKMVTIERNKLALVGEYLKLGDTEGARLLAQEVTASTDANLRARAEQILISLPTS